MPFDPDAYLAKQSPAAGAFDPDAYLKSKGAAAPDGVEAPFAYRQNQQGGMTTPRQDEVAAESKAMQNRSGWSSLGDVLGGSASSSVDIGRGMFAGAMSLPGELTDLVRKGSNFANKQMGGSSEYWKDQGVLPTFDKTIESIPRLGTNPTPYTSGFEQMGNAVAPIPGAGIGKAAKVISKVGESIAAPGKVLGRGYEALRGTQAAEAQGQALSAARGVAGDISKGYGEQQASKLGEANSLNDVAVRLQRDLDAAGQRNGRPTLDKQGETARTAYQGVMDTGKTTRAQAVEEPYRQAREIAAAREQDGARINIKPATEDIEKLLDLVESIPEIKNKLSMLLGTLKSKPKAPGTPGIVDQYGKPFAKPEPEGLTFEQLNITNQYLKDVAFGADLENYLPIVRKAAKDLSNKLDTQINEFVPEYEVANALYRKLSIPLDSLGTRFGQAMTSTEGGLKSDAYTKIANQDLPQKLFGKKEGIELMVDALAGGKGATKKARLAAQTQVDTMVEHWILEGAKGSTGAKAAQGLAAPQMQATMQAVPNVASRLGQKFAAEEQSALRIPELGKAADVARGESEISKAAKAKVDKSMAQAEVDYVHGSKKQAYQGYVNALRQNMVGDPERYKAVIGLIDRAATLQEKTDKARKLAMQLGIGAAAIGTGYEIRGILQ